MRKAAMLRDQPAEPQPLCRASQVQGQPQHAKGKENQTIARCSQTNDNDVSDS
jgi:hypothetical protein